MKNKLTEMMARRFSSAANTAAGRQRGATALEYLVLAAVIIVGLFIAGALFWGEGGAINDVFDEIGKTLTGKVKGAGAGAGAD